MKKVCTLLFAALTIFVGNSQAQILNPGFEQLNSDGSISYWGKTYFTSVVIDTGGGTIQDSIVIDQAYYASTTDAHSGNWALEMRNSFNFTQGFATAGGIGACSDSIFGGFSSLSTISVNEQPIQFGFYYKYFPAGTDWGWAHAMFYDSTGNQIADANMIFSDTVSEYTYIYTPVEYWMEGTISHFSLEFSTSAPCGSTSLGTRFLVDDVMFTSSSAGIEELETENYNVYPNPTNGTVNIQSEQDIKVAVYNNLGELLKTTNMKTIDISEFENGVYLFKITSKNNVSRILKVIKK